MLKTPGSEGLHILKALIMREYLRGFSNRLIRPVAVRSTSKPSSGQSIKAPSTYRLHKLLLHGQT